ELLRLKPVAPSMGMMLETTARRLFDEQGGPHYGSPDKDPDVRLRVLDDAGRVGVPFTTGVLVGIGETRTERAEALHAIRSRARQYRNIQEVIVQNFRAQPDTAMRSTPDAELAELAATVAVARLLLPPGVSVQAPPNLVGDEHELLLRAGIDDWGGVSPVTADHVNPERPWPEIGELAARTAEGGFTLRQRLTAYPKYVTQAEKWIDIRLHDHVAGLAAADGLAVADAVPEGRAWQEPDGGLESTGRTDLHTAVDDVGRTADRRGDFDTVYGDWEMLAEQVPAHTTPRRLDSTARAGLRLATEDPAALLAEENTDAAMALLTADDDALENLTREADALRADT